MSAAAAPAMRAARAGAAAPELRAARARAIAMMASAAAGSPSVRANCAATAAWWPANAAAISAPEAVSLGLGAAIASPAIHTAQRVGDPGDAGDRQQTAARHPMDGGEIHFVLRTVLFAVMSLHGELAGQLSRVKRVIPETA